MRRCAPTNAFLNALSLLNCGADHGTEFSLEKLTQVGDLQQDLEAYFDVLSARQSRAEPREDWDIRTEAYLGKWEEIIRPCARKWFFEGEFSPRADQWKSDAVIEAFIELVRKDTEAEWLYHLSTTPPVFYECAWDDFVLEAGQQRWILHFGVSD